MYAHRLVVPLIKGQQNPDQPFVINCKNNFVSNIAAVICLDNSVLYCTVMPVTARYH